MSIEIRKLTFRYSNFTLDVPKLFLESARMTSIVGPNGAGKTTLLKCISAVLPVKKGSLFIDGRDLTELRGVERARHLAYVPQEHGSVFNYRVLDFVLMGRAAYHFPLSSPSRTDVRVAEEALAFVGLCHFSSRPYFELSSGERRLVLIARALAQNSDILLLDEPTSFLDPKHEIEILELSRRLAAEKKKTVLITLHNLDMAVRYSDMMVFMKNGGVFASGRAADILAEELLEEVYEIPMKIIPYDGKKLIVI
ncbi:MAG: ABC transporter ATP-binding protein [Candidatus Aminicenantales bacterium]